MMGPSLVGIYREEIFSPGKVNEDAAVLDAAMAASLMHGFRNLAVIRGENIRVEGLDGKAPDGLSEKPSCILNMAQSTDSLHFLEALEKSGVRVINSVRSIRNCYRKSLIRCLSEAQVPLPRSRIMAIGDVITAVSFRLAGPFWVKRADVHATQPGDVAYVATKPDLDKVLAHLYRQNIQEVLVQEHVDGDVIKFYGVGPGHFFEAFRISTGERITPLMGILGQIANRSAKAVGLEIFGGDAVSTPQGEIVLIDLNAWPSFSPCAQSAAERIGMYVAHTILGGNNDVFTANEKLC